MRDTRRYREALSVGLAAAIAAIVAEYFIQRPIKKQYVRRRS